MKLVKRSGQEVDFDRTKIEDAIRKANTSVVEDKKLSEDAIKAIALDIENVCKDCGHEPTVEEVQNMVEDRIMLSGKTELARNYITYRYRHALRRKSNTTDEKMLSLLYHNNDEAKVENSNKNPQICSVMRDYMAGEVSRDLTERIMLPEDIVKAHKEGIIHFHDADYYAQPMHNCDLVNLDDMLQNGTVISGVMIEKPHRFSTACNIATQIIAQVASNQYGGQTITLTHLAPFVDISRKAIRKEVQEEWKEFAESRGMDAESMDTEAIEKVVEKRLATEIKAGVQTIQYQVVTLMTTNGQAPFLSVAMYLNECGEDKQLRHDLALIIEEVLKQRIQGVKNEAGVWVPPAFPKLLYFLEPDTMKGGEYYYLTELAGHCSAIAKRLVPDYISEKKMLELKGDAYPCMGCRSFLTPDRFTDAGKGNLANAGNYDPKKHKYYGRFNQGVVTINLPDVALSSGGDYDKFWEIFEERLELCHRALRCRHERLKGTLSDVAPILWQHGALARLKKGETIDKLLYDGYSTISLGYAGLYECVKYMTGASHTSEEGKPFAISVMQKMNDKCKEWKTAENIDYSLYGTPLESTTYKFAKCLQKRFGVIEDVTNHGYITNSYHVNVREHIDAFQKLGFEARFQELSPGGAISYVEIPDLRDNPEVVMTLIDYIGENIIYAELNTKSDYCFCCGWDGEIKIVEDDAGHLAWECPNCGNRDTNKMSVARRTCGYIGTQFWNQGRTEEIRDRVMHL